MAADPETTKLAVETSGRVMDWLGPLGGALGVTFAWFTGRTNRIMKRVEVLEKSSVDKLAFKEYIDDTKQVHLRIFDELKSIRSQTDRIAGMCEERSRRREDC